MLTDKIRDVMKDLLLVHDSEDTPPPVKDWLAGLIGRMQDADTVDERFIKGSQIPSGLGAQADEYAAVRDERLRVQKVAEGIKSRETEIYNCIMSTLSESTDTGASGKYYRVQRVIKERQQVTDWQAVYAFMKENDAMDLVQRRVNEKAIIDRTEAGQVIPGIETAEVPTLSFKKVD